MDEINLEVIDWEGESCIEKDWKVKDGDLINLTLGDRRAVIRIDKGKIAYVVIEEVKNGWQIQKELGEIDLYE